MGVGHPGHLRQVGSGMEEKSEGSEWVGHFGVRERSGKLLKLFGEVDLL